MSRENVKEEIVKNSFWSFINLVVNRFGSLILVIILVRMLMPEGYGLYSIVLSIAMIFFTLSHLGIDETLVRYLALAIKEDKKKIYAYHKYLLKIKFILAIVSFIVFILFAYPLAYYVFDEPRLFLPFLVAALYVFAYAFDNFYTHIFYSIEKVKYISIKEFVSQIFKIAFIAFIFYFVASKNYISSIFLMFAIVSLSMIFFNIFYLRRVFPDFFKKTDAQINKKKLKKFIGFLTIATISAVFFSYIDAIMIGIFLSPEFVGYYRAAFSLVFSLGTVFSFPNFVLLPFFTKMKERKTEEIFGEVFRYICIVTIPAIFGLIVLGKYFVRLFYGSLYAPAVLPLYFLSVLIFPIVSIGLFLSYFSAEGKPEIFAKLILITCVINIFLNLFFIKLFLIYSPLWAIVGAGIATIISWFIYFFSSVYVMKKKFGLIVPLGETVKPIISGGIMFLVLSYIISLFEGINLLIGIGLILLGVVVYLMMMILLRGLVKRDFELVRLLVKRKG